MQCGSPGGHSECRRVQAWLPVEEARRGASAQMSTERMTPIAMLIRARAVPVHESDPAVEPSRVPAPLPERLYDFSEVTTMA
jgi:hypothetical protein